MNGLGLALGALSGAISDTTKGFVESEDERRKVQEEARRNAEDRRREREEGRRAEVHQQQRELFPYQLDSARLGNEQTAQQIAVAGETHEESKRRWPDERRSARAQAQIAEANAHYAFDKAHNEYQESVKRLEVIEEQLKEARVKYPYLVDELERKKKAEEQTIRMNEDTLTMNALKIKEIEDTRAGEAAAEAALRRAGPSLPAVMKALAEHGRYVHPQNPIVRLLEAQIQAQASAAGQQNPLAALRETRQTLATAQNEAQQEAAAMLVSLDPMAAKEGGPGMIEMRNWLVQYHLAKRLRAYESPQLGIAFSKQDKAIPPMPSHLIAKLAEDPSKVSEIVGAEVDGQRARRIYTRMNQYVTEGREWNDALALAAADEFASWKGNPTASDGWIKNMKIEKSFYEKIKENVGPAAKSVLDRVWGTGDKLPDAALPPRVPTLPDPAVAKQQKLNELAQWHLGVSIEHLKRNKDTAALEWLEKLYAHEESKKQEPAK